jgi:hypothetical protein
VLARLRHRAVGGRNHQDRAVHLSRARYHVLHIVGVAGTVNVSVVPVLGLVLDVRYRYRYSALPLLGSVVDLVELRLFGQTRMRQNTRYRRRQSRLAVVHVAYRAHIDVWLGPLEFLLGHCPRRLLILRLAFR